MKDKLTSFVFKAKDDILANPKATAGASVVVITGIAVITLKSVLFVKAMAVCASLTITGIAGYAVYNYIKDNDSIFSCKINVKE